MRFFKFLFKFRKITYTQKYLNLRKKVRIYLQDKQKHGNLCGKRQPIEGVRCSLYRGIVQLRIQSTAEERHRIIAHGKYRKYFS